MRLGRTHRILIGVVVAGAVLIAAIGFAGSYAAVRDLAEQKGFGAFSVVFPIGIDAGIVVLLALDLLLTWIRIPFPLLRQTAWLLTAATIAFNGAAAWPDPLGVGMHAVIPVLFVVSVEAARHAIGRIADITADKHMEGVRLSRWLLAFPSTFRLWRRMKLWELRSYDEVIRLEQDRLVYQARLRARYGRAWRRKAPVESMMPLRLARYGIPLAETAPDGLAAAGIDPATPAAVRPSPRRPELTAAEHHPAPDEDDHQRSAAEGREEPTPRSGARRSPEHSAAGGTAPLTRSDLPADYAGAGPEPSGRNVDPLGSSVAEADAGPASPETSHPPTPEPDEEAYGEAFHRYVRERSDYPNARQFGLYLMDFYGIRDRTGAPIPEPELRPILKELREQADATVRRVHDGGTARPGMTGPAVGDHRPPGRPAVHRGAPATSARVGLGGVAAQPATSPSPDVAVPAQNAEGLERSSGGGAATARVPEQSPEPDEEQLRIQRVVSWLEEAERAGKKLAGAEVARRLGVSPSTGQRAVRKAKAVRKEQPREDGRTRLRSVGRNT
ncbi:DUF2637 domain-containing protein [Streptomyces sp. S07_1.15]|uniref:DUF2637 domain-containing protein n=1 Tax=Streptomyces sp. S07_1.15 TaxID=2873925 RepID=UPI001D15CE1E|nr:DUF2637 domain-containing protein [Streptomyces sp. S07_1.15]MCC3655852.1 DUF2637 domain-containing protein [Streptomyces sp. S07_1.15]